MVDRSVNWIVAGLNPNVVFAEKSATGGPGGTGLVPQDDHISPKYTGWNRVGVYHREIGGTRISRDIGISIIVGSDRITGITTIPSKIGYIIK